MKRSWKIGVIKLKNRELYRNNFEHKEKITYSCFSNMWLEMSETCWNEGLLGKHRLLALWSYKHHAGNTVGRYITTLGFLVCELTNWLEINSSPLFLILYILCFRELVHPFKLLALIPVCMIWSPLWHSLFVTIAPFLSFCFWREDDVLFIFLEIYNKNYLLFWKMFYWEQCFFEIQVTSVSLLADKWMVI